MSKYYIIELEHGNTLNSKIYQNMKSSIEITEKELES